MGKSSERFGIDGVPWLFVGRTRTQQGTNDDCWWLDHKGGLSETSIYGGGILLFMSGLATIKAHRATGLFRQ